MPVRWMIFDMDGVITSEDGYWRAAMCALLELAAALGAPLALDEDLPWRLRPDLRGIARAKALLINTNWDLCHLAAIALGCRLGAENVRRLREANWDADELLALAWPADFAPDLNVLLDEILAHAKGETGFALLEKLAQRTGAPELFARRGPVWEWLFRRFQEWFNGQPGRRGIIEDERLLLDPTAIAEALRSLRSAGWSLGIATGRTREELIPTLSRFGLIDYFEKAAVVTHDEVAAAEAELGASAHLSKPHPFPFLRALYPEVPARELVERRTAPPGTVIVGDTVADVAAAAAIGAEPIGVLTGPGGEAARGVLAAAGAKVILPDVLCLPQIYAPAAS